jgi:DnaK suppressor protein
MDKVKMQEVARKLETQAADLRKEIDEAEAFLRSARPQGGDEGDQAQHLNEGSAQRTFRDRAIGKLKVVNVALNRIKTGTFGECEDCGCDIDERRLAVNPAASKCTECQEDSERENKRRAHNDLEVEE